MAQMMPGIPGERYRPAGQRSPWVHAVGARRKHAGWRWFLTRI